MLRHPQLRSSHAHLSLTPSSPLLPPSDLLLQFLTLIQPTHHPIMEISRLSHLRELLLPSTLPIRPMLLPKVAHKVIERRLGLLPAHPTEDIDQVVSETFSRKLFEDGFILVVRDDARTDRWREIGTEEVGHNAEPHQADYRVRVVLADGGDGVNGDAGPEFFQTTRVPVTLDVVLLHVVLDKLDSQLGAIDFEALVFADEFFGGGPAEVVHEEREHGRLEVQGAGGEGLLERRDFVGEDTHEVDRADAVVDGGEGGVFAEVGEDGVEEGRRGWREAIDRGKRFRHVGIVVEFSRNMSLVGWMNRKRICWRYF